jgi:hypothetical protein
VRSKKLRGTPIDWHHSADALDAVALAAIFMISANEMASSSYRDLSTMTDHQPQPKQTELARFWALAKALLWAALAASIFMEVFDAMAPHPRALGFVAGIVFSVVMAYCNHRNKERFGQGFFSLPPE